MLSRLSTSLHLHIRNVRIYHFGMYVHMLTMALWHCGIVIYRHTHNRTTKLAMREHKPNPLLKRFKKNILYSIWCYINYVHEIARLWYTISVLAHYSVSEAVCICGCGYHTCSILHTHTHTDRHPRCIRAMFEQRIILKIKIKKKSSQHI